MECSSLFSYPVLPTSKGGLNGSTIFDEEEEDEAMGSAVGGLLHWA
jgi:hypothetical protein